jgi:nitroreductase
MNKVNQGPQMSDVQHKIAEYLLLGGLFNPELMDHEKVRDIMIESRDELDRLKKRLKEAGKVIGFYADVESWSYPMTGIPLWEIDKSDVDESLRSARPCLIGGKRAREYFKEKEA